MQGLGFRVQGPGSRVLGAGFGWRPAESRKGRDFPRSNEKQFRGGLVFRTRRLYVSLNSRPRVTKKKMKVWVETGGVSKGEGFGPAVRPSIVLLIVDGYRDYSKLRTCTALGSYGRAIPRGIGPP